MSSKVFGPRTYEIFPALRLWVPQVKLLPDKDLDDGREDSVAQDETEDGEDDTDHDEGDAAPAAPIHHEWCPLIQLKLIDIWLFYSRCACKHVAIEFVLKYVLQLRQKRDKSFTTG